MSTKYYLILFIFWPVTYAWKPMRFISTSPPSKQLTQYKIGPARRVWPSYAREISSTTRKLGLFGRMTAPLEKYTSFVVNFGPFKKDLVSQEYFSPQHQDLSLQGRIFSIFQGNSSCTRDSSPTQGKTTKSCCKWWNQPPLEEICSIKNPNMLSKVNRSPQ